MMDDPKVDQICNNALPQIPYDKVNFQDEYGLYTPRMLNGRRKSPIFC